MDPATPARPRRLARSGSAQSGAQRHAQFRIGSGVTASPRWSRSATTARKRSVYRRRPNTARRTRSVGS